MPLNSGVSYRIRSSLSDAVDFVEDVAQGRGAGVVSGISKAQAAAHVGGIVVVRQIGAREINGNTVRGRRIPLAKTEHAEAPVRDADIG